MRLLTAPLLLALALALPGCGSEREFSGVWRQTACGDGLAQADCGGFVYELHIGRYGDKMAGLVVRYRYDRSGFDTFQRPLECGCFYIGSGVADAAGMSFRLFDATTPRYPQPDTLDSELGCGTATVPAPCEGLRFVLEGDDELLTGHLDCGDDARSAQPIAFEKAVGAPRTECYERRGIGQ